MKNSHSARIAHTSAPRWLAFAHINMSPIQRTNQNWFQFVETQTHRPKTKNKESGTKFNMKFILLSFAVGKFDSTTATQCSEIRFDFSQLKIVCIALMSPSQAKMEKGCLKPCPRMMDPKCGYDGNEYKMFANECVLDNYNCKKDRRKHIELTSQLLAFHLHSFSFVPCRFRINRAQGKMWRYQSFQKNIGSDPPKIEVLCCWPINI